MKIVRTEAEIGAAHARAQAAAFAAEDSNSTDEGASTAYDLLQWLTGNAENDPTEEMGPDDGDDEQA